MSVDIAIESDPLIGQQLGSYHIQRLIGRGGMARIYEGLDFKLGRRAAIKVMDIRPQLHKLMTERFIREARAVARLDHPHIISVYEFGDDPVWYIAMKYVEGETLFSVLAHLRKQKKYLPSLQVVTIVSQLGAALDYAHSRGILHRDVKPSNIMIAKDNRAILTDFGLAIQQGAQSSPGTTLGTPRYVAPEQVLTSQHLVPQTDIYSLGVVLYEMVTGQTPFDDESPLTLALSHINKMPPPPQSLRPDLPHAVQTVMLKALEKRPENRWQTAAALADALRDGFNGIEPPALSSAPSAPDLVPLAPDEDTTMFSEPLPEGALSMVRQAQPHRRWRARAWLTFFVLMLVMLGAAIGTYGLVRRSTPLNQFVLPLAPTAAPRIRLIYGQDDFVIYNATGGTVSLEGVFFIRNDARSRPFPAARFGDRTHKTLAAGQCLRIVLREADEQAAPVACKAQARLLIFEDPEVVFWAVHNVTDLTRSFRVERNGQVLQICLMRLNTCEFTLS